MLSQEIESLPGYHTKAADSHAVGITSFSVNNSSSVIILQDLQRWKQQTGQ